MRFFNFGESLNQKTLRGKMKETAPNLLTPMGFTVRLFYATQVPPFSMKKHFYTKQIPQCPIQEH